jgi:NADH-quinone oxidoreductase subunit M
MPVYGAFMLIVALSSMGLPGLNGFVGEFAILLGAWGAGEPAGPLGSYAYAALAAIGVILAAVYMLWMYQRMFLGEVTNEKNRGLMDLSRREIAILAPLVILIFWIGLYPAPFLNLISPAVEQLASTLQSAAVAMR